MGLQVVADLNHLFFAALPRPSWDPCPGWAVVIDFACTRAGFLARFAARSRRSSIRKVTLCDVALSRLTSTVRLRGLDWEYGRGSSRRLRRARGQSQRNRIAFKDSFHQHAVFHQRVRDLLPTHRINVVIHLLRRTFFVRRISEVSTSKTNT